MNAETLFHYERVGFKFSIFANRIEVKRLGAFWRWSTETIFIRNINSVELSRFSNELRVRLVNGKQIKFTVVGQPAQDAYDTLMGLI